MFHTIDKPHTLPVTKLSASNHNQPACIWAQRLLNDSSLNVFGHTFLPLQILIKVSLPMIRVTPLRLLYCYCWIAADGGRSTLLVSLDLSAAFDTIDHDVLLSRLNHSFGVAGVAHSWIKTYLSHRSQVVRVGSHISPTVTCHIGVSQGSVLGPLLFSIYTSPIYKISRIHNVQQQQ